jgi:hypothetical protein
LTSLFSGGGKRLGDQLVREKPIKIDAKVVRHSKYVRFQLAEVAVPRKLFAVILERIGRLREAAVGLIPSG